MGRKKKEFVRITDKADLMLPTKDDHPEWGWREFRLTKEMREKLRYQRIKWSDVGCARRFYDSTGAIRKVEFEITFYGTIMKWDAGHNTHILLQKRELKIISYDGPNIEDAMKELELTILRWNKVGKMTSIWTGTYYANDSWNKKVDVWNPVITEEKKEEEKT